MKQVHQSGQTFLWYSYNSPCGYSSLDVSGLKIEELGEMIYCSSHTQHIVFQHTVNRCVHCALTYGTQLLKCLTARNSFSCSVSKLSGCAVWHSDWLLSKLISQQPLVQCIAGRRPGSGQPEKETPAAYSSVGRDAALLRGRGKCVTFIVRASRRIMDELGSKQEMKSQKSGTPQCIFPPNDNTRTTWLKWNHHVTERRKEMKQWKQSRVESLKSHIREV